MGRRHRIPPASGGAIYYAYILDVLEPIIARERKRVAESAIRITNHPQVTRFNFFRSSSLRPSSCEVHIYIYIRTHIAIAPVNGGKNGSAAFPLSTITT